MKCDIKMNTAQIDKNGSSTIYVESTVLKHIFLGNDKVREEKFCGVFERLRVTQEKMQNIALVLVMY